MSDEFVARYYRFHQLHEEPEESIEDAIGLLAAGLDNGDLMPENIVRRDGTVVLDHEETMKRAYARQQQWDEDESK
jgi:hypothetical protein